MEINHAFLQKEASGFYRDNLRLTVLLLRFISVFVLSLVLFASFPVQGWTEIKDDTPPQRIISLSPGVTEILFAIGAGDRVVGVTEFCNYHEKPNRSPRLVAC